MTPETAAIVAELRLFNHKAAADLIERLAAAPSALAEAWERGYEKGALSQFEEPNNPYRPTP